MFKNQSPEERKAAKEKEKKIDEALNQIIRQAKKIIGSEDYLKYKTMFEEQSKKAMDMLMSIDCHDPVEYAFVMQRFIERLRILKSVLELPEGKAKLTEKGV